MINDCDLIKNINKIKTTKLGIDRIKQNLGLETEDVVEWCKQIINQTVDIIRTGKNWYINTGDAVITINANSYTIITAHKITAKNVITSDLSDFEFENAYNAILSMIHKLEKTQDKLKQGSPQNTLLIQRLKALHIAMMLIERELKK
jgi:hypothetical protein